MKLLIEKTGYFLGSVSYTANKYNDFNNKIANTKQLGHSNFDKILNLRKNYIGKI